MNQEPIKLFVGQTDRKRSPTPDPHRAGLPLSEVLPLWERCFPDEVKTVTGLIEGFHEKDLTFPLSKKPTPTDFAKRCRSAVTWREGVKAVRVELGNEIGLLHPRGKNFHHFLSDDLAGLRKQLTFVIQPEPTVVKLYSWQSLENCLQKTFTTINAALFRSDWYHEWADPDAEVLASVVKGNIFESLRLAIAARICGSNVDLKPLLDLWSAGFIPLSFTGKAELACLFGRAEVRERSRSGRGKTLVAA